MCKTLYKFGATIYAFSRSAGPLNALKTDCPNIHTTAVDLSSWEQTRNALKVLEGKTVHGLVNNAGIAVIKPFLEITEDDLDK